MGRRSKVLGLPAEVKTWLDRALLEGNFSEYEALASVLKDKGYAISKSALHRYGAPFEVMMSKLKLSREKAEALMAAAGDDKGAMNDALIRGVMGVNFSILEAEYAEGLDDPSRLRQSIAANPNYVRAMANLVRASVTQKEWGAKVARTLDAAVEKGEADLAEGKNPRDVLAAIRAAYQGAL